MTPRSKTVCKFLVRVELPSDSNVGDMQKYIRDAVSCFKGGLEPTNPLFDLNTDGLTVALVEKTTTYGRQVYAKCP